MAFGTEGSVTRHVTGGDLLGRSEQSGKLFYRVPKADGGYDYYSFYSEYDANGVPTNPDIRPVSEANAYEEMGLSVPEVKGETYTPTTTYDSSGGSEYTPEQERAYYDDQINTINTLLGTVAAQRTSGLNTLNDQKRVIMEGYGNQKSQNAQAKQRGIESVDSFANNSYQSLQRLLQGANAGNSSVGQSLVPYLISKGAGNRRQGVFQTAGENEQNIDQAINSTNAEFGDEKTGGGKIGEFLTNLLLKQQELDGEKASLQTKRAIANGSGYEAARAAASATRAGMSGRQSEINGILGNFTPTTKTPELGTYTVDPAQIRTQNQGIPGESSYYLTQLLNKRKKETV